MKIWIVSHFWDNGEKYREDLLEYQDYKIFSTYQKAMDYYCSCIIPKYIGQYILDEYEVDTHEVMQLEKSPWEDCPCQYPDYEPEYEPEEPDYDTSELEEKLDEYHCPSEFLDFDYSYEISCEEQWLTHKGENYQVFKEIEECEIAKLIKDLDELLTIK